MVNSLNGPLAHCRRNHSIQGIGTNHSNAFRRDGRSPGAGRQAERGEPETIAFADQLYRDLSRGASFADAARNHSRSATAEKGGAMDEVAITQMPPAIRAQILVLRPGQVTRPMPIGGGVAILKLISTRQAPPEPIKADDPAVRDALRQQLFSERITSFGQGYLQELLSDALIVTR